VALGLTAAWLAGGAGGRIFIAGALPIGVVLAAGGYPGTVRKGDVIGGLDDDNRDTKVFHAGTASRDGDVVTAGGRVLCVTALGDSVRSAQRLAYERAARIHFEQMQYRRDIGYRAVARESKFD
jgi:phosphoribosylamine--glycine ligase